MKIQVSFCRESDKSKVFFMCYTDFVPVFSRGDIVYLEQEDDMYQRNSFTYPTFEVVSFSHWLTKYIDSTERVENIDYSIKIIVREVKN